LPTFKKEKLFTAEAQRKNFIVNCAVGAANDTKTLRLCGE
jgi:hypothetical protein